MSSFAAHLAAARARREQPAPVAEVSRTIRISSDMPSGELWSSRFPWVREGDWGRAATVQLASGAIRQGYLVPPDFERPDGWDTCLVYEGVEVVVEAFDKHGTLWFDRESRKIPQPSDRGSGGLDWHRGADGPLVHKVWTPEQYERETLRRAVLSLREQLAQVIERTCSGWVLVCGGRTYSDREAVLAAMAVLAERVTIEGVRHGAARGADQLAEQWAQQRGIETDPCPADWESQGRGAGPARNAEMLRRQPRPVVVVAFPGGAGTRDMVKQAGAVRVPVWRVVWTPPVRRRG